MNYAYDILLNFINEERVYEFFEWQKKDNIKNINRIPVFLLKEEDLVNIINNKVIIDKEFLKLINNKTIVFEDRKDYIIKYACIITDKTKFMLVCYLYGMPLNIKEIKKICKDNNIILVEDAAQAFGTKVNNKYVGTYGDAGCYSFNDTKMLRIGEGGAVVTNDKKVFEAIEHFRHVGEVFKANMESSVSSNSTYGDLLFNGLSNDGRGLNLRPSPVTFSTGLKRIEVIDKYISDRRKKYRRYYYELSNIEGVNLIKNCNFNKLDDYAPIAYWIVLDKEKYDRNKVILGCINMGIPVGSFNYNTVIKNDYFNKFIKNKKDDLEDSQYIRDNSIFLPLYENISVDDVKKICKAFKYVIREYNKDNKDLFNEKVYDEEIVYFDGFYLMR